MRTAPMIGVDIHFGPDSIRHKYHPGDDKCPAYGVLKIDNGGSTHANLYFDTDPAHIDKMIAELVALKQEMDPPVITAPERPAHRLACGCTDPRCDCPGCQAGKPHEPGTPWNCDEHGKTAIAAPVVADGEPWTRAGVAAAIMPAPSGMQDPAPVARLIDAKAPAPDGNLCPATTGPDEELDVTLYCDREAGHHGSHHAPGPGEGSQVAWSGEAAAVIR